MDEHPAGHVHFSKQHAQRQDLAPRTSSTTETVSRVMSRFAGERPVKSGRKWVTLTDTKRLEELTKKGAVN